MKRAEEVTLVGTFVQEYSPDLVPGARRDLQWLAESLLLVSVSHQKPKHLSCIYDSCAFLSGSDSSGFLRFAAVISVPRDLSYAVLYLGVVFFFTVRSALLLGSIQSTLHVCICLSRPPHACAPCMPSCTRKCVLLFYWLFLLG